MARRMLVVDDDRQMVRTLTDIFRLRGWDVAGAYSGEEAIESVNAGNFDIVLMDILMPGINGVEALRRIRASNPSVRVLLMTAHSSHELMEQAQKDGAIRVLSKPVVIPELLKFLEEQRPSGQFVVVLDADDDDFSRTLELRIRDEGHDVHRAGSLDTALRVLVDQPGGVVLLNLPLEDLDPHESVLAIRRIEPSVILVLCSAVPSLLEETSHHIPPDWVYARLMKPFPPDRLLEMLDEIR